MIIIELPANYDGRRAENYKVNFLRRYLLLIYGWLQKRHAKVQLWAFISPIYYASGMVFAMSISGMMLRA